MPLRDELTAVGVEPTDAQLDLLLRYLDLIAHWRTRARLTAVTDPIEAVRVHLADALLALRVEMPIGASLIDVGSGAGLPGIPIVILRNDLAVTLLEPQARKAAFLETALREMGLRATVVCEAAEIAARAGLRERLDIGVARAVAPLPVVCELTLPFVKVGGRAVLLKGPSVRAELRDGGAAARVLGGADPELSEWSLKGGERRVLVVIRKLHATPSEFPRRPGVPRRRPLKA